ncbi:MAG: DUF732 domain-containing protein [Mycobacterium sp.]|nr:DUF732 domain-containing protein [Mycobacterium sp.]
MLRNLAVSSAAVAVLLAAPTVVGTAHADDDAEVAYILSLNQYGVTYASPGSAILAGYQACGQLRSGPPSNFPAIKDYWADKFGSFRTGSAVVAAASRYLCPEQLAIIDNWIRSQPPDIP